MAGQPGLGARREALTVPHWLDIDAHGRVAPGGDEARRTLAGGTVTQSS